jgi:hypothetical protein
MSNHGGTSDTGFTYAGMAGAVGGLLGVVGIYVGKWFSYGYAVSGGHVTFYLNGSEDWTGQVAFIAGLTAFAFGVAYVLLSERQIRTITGALMGVGGIFLLAMSLLAFSRIDEAVGAAPFSPGVLPGVPVAITQSPAGGLCMSIIGGVIAVYGAFLALRKT